MTVLGIPTVHPGAASQRGESALQTPEDLRSSILVAVVELVGILFQVVELSLAGVVLDVEVVLRPYGFEAGAASVLGPYVRPEGALAPVLRPRVAAERRFHRVLVDGGSLGPAEFGGGLNEEG